jgi:hypothetical protein
VTATGLWFSPGPQVSSTNKTDNHDMTEILLKVALNTTTLTLTQSVSYDNSHDIHSNLLTERSNAALDTSSHQV